MYDGGNRPLKAEPNNDNEYTEQIEPIPLLFSPQNIKDEDPVMGYDLSLQRINSSCNSLMNKMEPVPSTSSTALSGTGVMLFESDLTQKHEPELNIDEDEELDDDNDSDDFSTDAEDDNKTTVVSTPVYDHQAFPPSEVSFCHN